MRRLRIELDLHADSMGDLVGALRSIANNLELDGEAAARQVTSGGYASGYHMTLTVDPEMDHDRYAAALEARRG